MPNVVRDEHWTQIESQRIEQSAHRSRNNVIFTCIGQCFTIFFLEKIVFAINGNTIETLFILCDHNQIEHEYKRRRTGFPSNFFFFFCVLSLWLLALCALCFNSKINIIENYSDNNNDEKKTSAKNLCLFSDWFFCFVLTTGKTRLCLCKLVLHLFTLYVLKMDMDWLCHRRLRRKKKYMYNFLSFIFTLINIILSFI